VFKLVIGGLALLAGVVVRDVGRTYSSVAAAFDERRAEDAADEAMFVRRQAADRSTATRRPRSCGPAGRHQNVLDGVDLRTGPPQQLS
jgi:hypothetical protein